MSKEIANEEQWFSQHEAELIRDAKKRHADEKAARDEKVECELKKAHWMKCPKCGHDMKTIMLDSIELDKCTNCEGIYFDAGELDELLLAENDKKKSIFRKLMDPIF